jgi:hypothetical protein
MNHGIDDDAQVIDQWSTVLLAISSPPSQHSEQLSNRSEQLRNGV